MGMAIIWDRHLTILRTLTSIATLSPSLSYRNLMLLAA
jgi:hypothetical protein